MQTYLLDTCIWSYWFYETRREHASVLRHAEMLPSGTVLGISTITWGEIEYGWRVAPKGHQDAELRYRQFIGAKKPMTFHIDKHTTVEYARLRALLFEKHAPKDRRKKARWPEELIDPTTSKELGIQENDLWIAAQAVVRNLVLVTSDKLVHIREAAGDCLHIENWTR